ncbi:TPA: hypothetical protein ACQ850_002546 [Klebsiella pneumoniae]|uniref:hypothetical protein n=1 Tax=Klebsiella pneumoniae TaxID=573 RepID=UPI0028B83C3E|nr:hypothetical protein [Klebsiella pneumoniae]MDW1402064.1 hypothetical protein [Klebsiella pneumoniae]HDY7340756.1 hypothetical protein [Klebsiella pneumoniae]
MISNLTRGELEEVVSTYGKKHIAHRMATELLAALDSEPLGWCLHGMAPAFTADKEKAEYWISRGWDVLSLYRHAQPVAAKDHLFRELVNELRDVSLEYHSTQQLRERIASTLRKYGL